MPIPLLLAVAARFFCIAAAVLSLLALPVTGHTAEMGKRNFKIDLIGAGRIGGTLGELWVRPGHEVLLSSRHPEQLQSLAKRLEPLVVGPLASARQFDLESAVFARALTAREVRRELRIDQ